MKTASQLHSELHTMLEEQKSIFARMEALKFELEQLQARVWPMTKEIKAKTEAVRDAQEKEWKPSQKWDDKMEFIIQNAKGLSYTTKNEYNDPEITWKREPQRWKREKTAQIHLAKALEIDPSCVLWALPMKGENFTVPHRPVHTV